jgi:hypothetical protein
MVKKEEKISKALLFLLWIFRARVGQGGLGEAATTSYGDCKFFLEVII